MRLLRRLWESPRLVPVLSVMTVIALAGAAFSVFGVLAQDDARERDRIKSDLAACSRGNVLRGQVIAIGEANDDLVVGVLDAVIPDSATGDPVRDARIDAFRNDIKPIIDRYRSVIGEIELTDCEAAVPGATTTTEAP